MKQQINFRASELTGQQLAQLTQQTGMLQTEVISVAIDRMFREEIKMKNIRLGTKNDTFAYAVEIDGRYHKMGKEDLKFEQPDAKIYFDSGVYPGITDIDQYMCDKANNQPNFTSADYDKLLGIDDLPSDKF